jgi:hypothetical protein
LLQRRRRRRGGAAAAATDLKIYLDALNPFFDLILAMQSD